jgi:hypothetical protein
MDTREFFSTPGGWQWPEDLPGATDPFKQPNHEPPSPEPTITSFSQPNTTRQPPSQQQDGRRPRHWKPRTCRICLETVLPTFTVPSEHVPEMFQSPPSVVYESEDGGRLLRPCKCKGTAQYVHEGCLQAWRHADPGYARRNYFQCPTCAYRYRLQRLGWGRMISSVGMPENFCLQVIQTKLTIFLQPLKLP